MVQKSFGTFRSAHWALAVGAAATLSACDWDDEWRGRDYQRQDLRHDYRDLSGDYGTGECDARRHCPGPGSSQ
jgi:hypothetical protein